MRGKGPDTWDERDILNLTRRQIWPRGDKMKPDFMVHRTPILGKKTPVASIGSCFAARMKTFLVKEGFNYIQASRAPGSEIGSAAWGTVYNTACINQEFARGLGLFNPAEKRWANGAGGLMSPYRKGVEWKSPDAADRETEAHGEAVYRTLKAARVFILTVGLCEIWHSTLDGAVFFQTPPARIYNRERHGFRFADLAENVRNLRQAISTLRCVSPDCQVILTVSPVPLRATFRDMNVIAANAESKATLLVAAHEVADPGEGIHYFPSYELVTVVNRDNPFEPDNRHPKHAVTDRVWSVFSRSFIR